MSPWWRIGDAVGDLPRLLLHAIFLPGRGRKPAGEGPPPLEEGTAAAAAGSPPARRSAGGRRRVRAEAGQAAGNAVLIGGTTLADEVVLEMIRLAGGREARIVILPTASLDFTRSGERYARGFRRFGAARVEVLDVVTRPRADDPQQAARLKGADLVFLGGGDAALFLEVLRHTPVHAALLEVHRAGGTVAGIGAGAAVLGSFVPVSGTDEPALVPGLGLVPCVLVEQRVLQMGQPGRFFYALAARDGVEEGVEAPVGIGLDDGTAFLAQGREGRVIGRGMAIIASHRNGRAGAADAAPGLFVHVLPSGYRYDFRSSRPLPPPPETPSLREAR